MASFDWPGVSKLILMRCPVCQNVFLYSCERCWKNSETFCRSKHFFLKNIVASQPMWYQRHLGNSAHIAITIECVRAVVKSTFVESKTSPSPGLSSQSQDRVQRGSSPSQDRVQRGSSPSQVRVQIRQSKQGKKKLIYFKTTYLIIDNLCDTRDSISSILRYSFCIIVCNDLKACAATL